MVSENVLPTNVEGHRERPSLLPWNRRLRHLQGISIRNVNVVRSLTRSRGRTISDDDLPANLQSPAKLLAQRETQKLKHSSSAADLKSPYTDDRRLANSSGTNESPTSRPRPPKLRRRSTLHAANTRPQARQQELRELVASTMADTMITLHCEPYQFPIYMSEVMEQSLNPSYQSFDLNGLGPYVTRLEKVTVKLWAKTATMTDFEALVWLEANFQSLQFIGSSLDNFNHPLPENCIIFQLSDGFYTSFTDLPMEFNGMRYLAVGTSRGGMMSAQSTASYDALMRLANLDECIQDALSTQRKLEAQIDSVLKEHRQTLSAETGAKQARESLARIKHAVSATKVEIATRGQDIDILRRKLDLRRKSMNEGRLARRRAEREREENMSEVKQYTESLSATKESTNGQIRRIGEELLSIFPIEPITGRALHFTIRSLALPNSTFDDINKDSIAGALGYTAQLVHLLSQYLSVPLPYPIQPYASQSYVQDPISAGISQRTFPLYPGSVQYRFEYGVFLLNKNIEFLMNKYGLKMLDIRHTLPNLKYLLYVLTAGTGEIPLRKAGGVKALITGRLSPSMSRRESEDSAFSSTAAAYLTPKDLENDRNRGAQFFSGQGQEKRLADAFPSDGMLPSVGTFKRNVSHKASMPRESF